MTTNHWKIIESTFSFPEFVSPCKKFQVYSIRSFLRYSQFYSPVTRPATPIFDHAHQKHLWSAFNFRGSVSTCKKNQFTPSVHSSDTVNFRVPSPHCPHPFLTMLSTKSYNHLFISVNLYQQTKNQLIPSVHSCKVQRPDWP